MSGCALPPLLRAYNQIKQSERERERDIKNEQEERRKKKKRQGEETSNHDDKKRQKKRKDKEKRHGSKGRFNLRKAVPPHPRTLTLRWIGKKGRKGKGGGDRERKERKKTFELLSTV